MSRSPTLAEVLNSVRSSAYAGLRVSLPGRVEKYNATTQLVDVKPLVKDSVRGEDGELEEVSLPVITNVPLMFPGAGGFHITFPVQRGDTVLLVFADRSIDTWQATGAEAGPSDQRRHHLSDAFAIPGLHHNGAAIPSVDASVITLGLDTGAADFVALATKVATELAAIRSTFNGHTHVESGGTTATPLPLLGAAGSVASASVKVKG